MPRIIILGYWFVKKILGIVVLGLSLSGNAQSSMFVSLCDKLHNGTCIVSDHKKVGKKIWKRFTATPKQVAWYYESLYKEFSKHLKGHKALKDNYLGVVKEIKKISSK